MRLGRLILAAALAAVGCTGGGVSGYSAHESCYDVWESVCARYYQCYNETQVASAGLPPTAAECTTFLGDRECQAFTTDECAGGLTFYPGYVVQCTDAILVADCTLIADAPGTVTACDPVCQ